MRIPRGWIAASLLATALTANAACIERGRLYVRVGPPVAIVETRAVSPGPGYIWIDGHHRWDGRAYVWVPGRWEAPPRVRAVWVPGHWVEDRHGWYFVDGYWR